MFVYDIVKIILCIFIGFEEIQLPVNMLWWVEQICSTKNARYGTNISSYTRVCEAVWRGVVY